MTLIIWATFVEYKHVEVKIGQSMSFYTFDLDLDPVTLIFKIDLDMVKMHLYTKVTAWTDIHTYRHKYMDGLKKDINKVKTIFFEGNFIDLKNNSSVEL